LDDDGGGVVGAVCWEDPDEDVGNKWTECCRELIAVEVAKVLGNEVA
jgi:hypothetical protein